MKSFNLITHYFYLFLAGSSILIAIYDIINYSKGKVLTLYGNPVGEWYFILYMISLFFMAGILLVLSKNNLDSHIKKQLDASDKTL